MIRTILLLTALLASASLHAQSPYAGEENRAIKALSPAAIDAYLAGRGMGLAKAAELNGYPGPMHVLELASQLELSAAQLAQTQALFDAMQSRAIELGEALVAAEVRLDQQFADGSISEVSLRQSLERIAALQGDLRGTHLEAHLAQTRLLSDAQIAAYVELRGYHAMEHGADHGADHSAHPHH